RRRPARQPDLRRGQRPDGDHVGADLATGRGGARNAIRHQSGVAELDRVPASRWSGPNQGRAQRDATGDAVPGPRRPRLLRRLPDGRRVPRPLETVVRCPATPGRHPLIVFAHGFALTPATYHHLLDAWAQAGYVVAAPVFPLTTANAPGGPDEADIVNQPRDMSFVITKLLAENARARGVLADRIDPS